jgi:hypothetical protein
MFNAKNFLLAICLSVAPIINAAYTTSEFDVEQLKKEIDDLIEQINREDEDLKATSKDEPVISAPEMKIGRDTNSLIVIQLPDFNDDYGSQLPNKPFESHGFPIESELESHFIKLGHNKKSSKIPPFPAPDLVQKS